MKADPVKCVALWAQLKDSLDSKLNYAQTSFLIPSSWIMHKQVLLTEHYRRIQNTRGLEMKAFKRIVSRTEIQTAIFQVYGAFNSNFNIVIEFP